MHCHRDTNTIDIHGPLQTRGETRCPGGVIVSCLASRTRHECPQLNESVCNINFSFYLTKFKSYKLLLQGIISKGCKTINHFRSIFSFYLRPSNVIGMRFLSLLYLICNQQLCPVLTVEIVENNEIRIQKKSVSGHILLAFLSHYSRFSSNSYHNILHSSPFARQTRIF